MSYGVRAPRSQPTQPHSNYPPSNDLHSLFDSISSSAAFDQVKIRPTSSWSASAFTTAAARKPPAAVVHAQIKRFAAQPVSVEPADSDGDDPFAIRNSAASSPTSALVSPANNSSSDSHQQTSTNNIDVQPDPAAPSEPTDGTAYDAPIDLLDVLSDETSIPFAGRTMSVPSPHKHTNMQPKPVSKPLAHGQQSKLAKQKSVSAIARSASAIVLSPSKPILQTNSNSPRERDDFDITDSNHATVNGSSTSLSRSESMIRAMRTRNLATKSATVLLVELLLGKRSDQLFHLEQDAMAEIRQAGGDATRLAAASRRSVGFNADTRSLRRRADGYICDSDAVLEAVVAALLKSGADLTYNDSDGNTALALAVQYRGGEQMVRMMLASDSTGIAARYHTQRRSDDVDADAGSLLDIALKMSSPTLVLTLLKHGALPTKKGYISQQEESDTHLLSNRTLLRVITLGEFSALHGFEKYARAKLTAALVDAIDNEDVDAAADAAHHGADVEMMDSEGQSLLYRQIKSKSRSPDMVRVLLEAGANPNTVDESGVPAAMYVIVSTHAKSLRILELLVKHGLCSQLTMGDNSKQTLLQFTMTATDRGPVIDLMRSATRTMPQLSSRQRQLQHRSPPASPKAAPLMRSKSSVTVSNGGTSHLDTTPAAPASGIESLQHKLQARGITTSVVRSRSAATGSEKTVSRGTARSRPVTAAVSPLAAQPRPKRSKLAAL